jgi:hypothetical protein
MSITLEYSVSPSGDINPFNDTLRREQNFYNFYARDDGTAEKAYGLEGTGAELAYRFFVNKPDTLRAIYIHFAHIDGDVGNLLFSLKVWDLIDTTESSDESREIYSENFLFPSYVDSINGLFVYWLEEPVAVDSVFYVGWLQSQSNLLNVGYDRNTDSKDHTFFRIGGNWTRSQLDGSVMIRPLVGANYNLFTTAIEEIPVAKKLTIRPNPVKSTLYFDLENSPHFYGAEIMDYTGKVMYRQQLTSNEINVNDLPTGIFLIKVIDKKDNRAFVNKFVKIN